MSKMRLARYYRESTVYLIDFEKFDKCILKAE